MAAFFRRLNMTLDYGLSIRNMQTSFWGKNHRNCKYKLMFIQVHCTALFLIYPFFLTSCMLLYQIIR